MTAATNTILQKKLETLSQRASRISYEALEIHSIFCEEGFLSSSDQKYFSRIGTKLIKVLEKEISKIEQSLEKINSFYCKESKIE
jgi:hypothetical protein